MSGGTEYGLVGTGLRLELLAAIRRQRAELDARETELLASLAEDGDPYRDGVGGLGKQWIREDVACALRVPSSTAAAKLQIARDLASRFPATVRAMREAVLDARYASRLVDAAAGLDDASAAEVERRVLTRAAQQTVAQFAVSVRRAVLGVDPRTAQQREVVARADRRVVFTPVGDGMTELWALLPAEQAAALAARIRQLAESSRSGPSAHNDRADDDRTADQLRADALCSLGELESVDGRVGAVHGRDLAPSVQVTVALSTLLELDDNPGELAGYGPISSVLVRAIAFDPSGTWRRLVTDKHGQLLDVSSRTYRPPLPMARLVRARDRTCRFPGCRRSAARSELDHVRAWSDGGSTRPANLVALCSRHHHLKHDADWRLARAPDGTLRWTSPTGQVHVQPPPDPLPIDTTARNAPNVASSADAANPPNGPDAPPWLSTLVG